MHVMLEELIVEVEAERASGSVTLTDRIALAHAVQTSRLADAMEHVLDLAKRAENA